MYRIATWYESGLGRNDGNPLYVTAFLKRMQYFCDVKNNRLLNPNLLRAFPQNPPSDPFAEQAAEDFMQSVDSDGLWIDHLRPYGEVKTFGEHDLNIWVDWGEDGLKGLLPYEPFECPKPMAYWASDTHLGYDYRLSMAKKADWVFCAQKRAVEEMKRDGIANPVWLPHAVEPLAYPKFNFASKKYDVCFVGHVNSQNRIDALDRLFKEFPNFYYGQKRFEKAAEIYGQSKIVFNIAMKQDTNMRCFESMATGSMLLTDRIENIEELFEDGKHCVLYDNLDDMVEKAKYYIAHDAEREKIAQAGYEEVMKKHTFKNRVMTMLEVCTREVANANR